MDLTLFLSIFFIVHLFALSQGKVIRQVERRNLKVQTALPVACFSFAGQLEAQPRGRSSAVLPEVCPFLSFRDPPVHHGRWYRVCLQRGGRGGMTTHHLEPHGRGRERCFGVTAMQGMRFPNPGPWPLAPPRFVSFSVRSRGLYCVHARRESQPIPQSLLAGTRRTKPSFPPRHKKIEFKICVSSVLIKLRPYSWEWGCPPQGLEPTQRRRPPVSRRSTTY